MELHGSKEKTQKLGQGQDREQKLCSASRKLKT